KELAVRTLDELHQIILDLRPSMLDDLGLVSAIRWYAESRLESQGIKASFETSGDEQRLPSQMETALFRVVQEAITNIAKHAEADNVVISLEFNHSTISIEVEDDGRGFDIASLSRAADKSGGLGLMGMKERIGLLDGTLTIDSEPSRGTRLSIKVPLPEKDGAGAQDKSANS
ncbi:MAG: sensor histidine kinase, partial [Chloroflexota bacterium]|nr:sensor histidine kinase [Chloroflexota bacterium]